jgi:hypothetical protein
MRVADVDLPPSAVAELALILYRAREVALAQRVGRAVDNNRDAVDLMRRDYEAILRVLDEPPNSLAKLPAGLRERIRNTRPPD